MSEFSLEIRPETIPDFPHIADLIAAAFEINFLDENRPSWCLGEIALVDFLRRGHSYLNELALVAIHNKTVIGYIMLTPRSVRLAGSVCEAIDLSILAVSPSFQRRGVGTALIRESLRRASERGYPFCYLFGHDTYYPRFGFQTGMFGQTFVEVLRFGGSGNFRGEQVQPIHLKRLSDMDDIVFGNIDLSYRPMMNITEWKSSLACLESMIVKENECVIGYVRFIGSASGPVVKKVISDSPENFRKCLIFLFSRFPDAEKLRIPIHPQSSVLQGLSGEVSHGVMAAGLSAILVSGFTPVEKYCHDVKMDAKQCGMVTFPIGYDTL
jgi:predicted N-acetyltransferase YhbS